MGSKLSLSQSSSSKLSPSHLYRSESIATRVIPLVVTALGGVLVLVSGRLARGCDEVHLSLALTASAERASENVGACTISTGRLQLSYGVDIVAALLYGLGLAASLISWWRYGWRSRRQAAYGVALGVSAVPVLAMLIDLAENITVMISAEVIDDRLVIGSTAAELAGTFGTSKWILVGVSILALALTLYGAVVFRVLKLWPVEGRPDATLQVVDGGMRADDQPVVEQPSGSAICLSGGGIRAASFAWGALAQLESSGRLRTMTSMYSISGGGYSAASYTASKGLSDDHFTLPAPGGEDRRDDEPITTPYEFVHARREYLDNRRGGVGFAVVRVLAFIVVNLSVIFAGLVVLTVPIAMRARSRYGSVLTKPEMCDGSHPLDCDVPWGLMLPGGWVPVLWPLFGAAAMFVISWFLGRKHRPKVLAVMSGLVALSAAVFLITVAVPWGAVMLDHYFTVDWKAVLPGVVTWGFGVVLALFRKRLPTMAIRLGGVVAAAAMIYGVLLVTNWVIYHPFESWGWPVLWLVAIVYLVVFDHTGVQWWSMHPLYRDRLASTFVMERRPDGSIATQPVTEWTRWSGVSEELTPKHYVCAATHRHGKEVTGLRAISYRFSRDGVDMFVPRIDSDGSVAVDRFSQSAEWFDAAVGAPQPEPGSVRRPVVRRTGIGGLAQRITRPTARSSVIATAAMSGAAVNSALGRHSKGSTDSLLAMLNLRLGVWLPNQRFQTHGDQRFPKAGLRYLFHEVIGYYSAEDPFVQVSDGGHWENLGLVEALRDRHEVIVLVDASGGSVAPTTSGPDGKGFNELYEAIDLARIELHVEVRIDVARLRPDPVTGRAASNWVQGEVIYHTDPGHSWATCSCPKGTVLYVKDVISDTTPEDVLAFANVDRQFPDYSTADQFLTEAQFRSLVRLGDTAMAEALDNTALL